MIDHINYLNQARTYFYDLMKESIRYSEMFEDLSQLKIILKSGVIIYIKYNQFGEYGYQVVHSRQKDDFSLFDNYDDRWNVKTRPHHFHDKSSNTTKSSPMKGIPKIDIPILVSYIKNKKIEIN